MQSNFTFQFNSLGGKIIDYVSMEGMMENGYECDYWLCYPSSYTVTQLCEWMHCYHCANEKLSWVNNVSSSNLIL